MKPNFALNLSHEGISLLHRAKAGWLRVGDVALDDPNLNEHLRLLRQTAADLESGGLTSKLVIPNSQVLYTEIEAPGPDTAARISQIRDGLVGLTPYDVNDLIFDWRLTGTRAQVAVVARETLAEAEAFAAEFRFNPMSFIAVPVDNEFEGEPFFGLTRHAATLLPDGETIEPDREPMTILGAGAAHAPKPTPDSKLKSKPGPEPKPEPESEPDTNAPDVGDVVAPPADKPAAKPKTAEPAPVKKPKAPAKTKPKPKEKPKPASETQEQPKAAPPVPLTFASRRTAPPPSLPSVRAAAPRPARTAPPPPRTAPPPLDPVPPAAAPAEPGVFPGFSHTSALDLDDVPDMPAWRSMNNGREVTPMAMTAAHTADPQPESKRRPKASSAEAAALAREKALAAGTALVGTIGKLGQGTAAGMRRMRERKGAIEASNTEADSLTVFGERGGSRTGGKPRYLGLFLTLLLLLALAILALWSTFFLGDPDTTLNTPEDPAQIAAVDPVQPLPETPTPGVPETPTPDPEPAEPVVTAPEPAPDTPADPIETAVESALSEALGLPQDPAETGTPAGDLPGDDVAALDNASDRPPPDRITRPPPTRAEAETSYAATGIWQMDPEPLPGDTGGDRLERLNVATIDPSVVVSRAAPLPDATSLGGDVRPPTLSPPAELGVRFDLDERGLVRATPEGTLSPDGIRVFSGPPSVIPGVRPGTIAPENVTPDPLPLPQPGPDPLPVPQPLPQPEPDPEPAVTEPAPETTQPTAPLDPELERLRDIRPPARPDSLQETRLEPDEPAQTDGLAPDTLARPAIRPTSLQGTRTAVPLIDLNPEPEAETQAADTPDTGGDGTELAVLASLTPRARPRDFSSTVEKALEEATETGQTPAKPKPEIAAARVPSIPTRASVAKQATVRNAIHLGKINLIGVYGSAADRRALIRLKSGRYVKVEVGDKIDGGRVAAIGDGELRYVKGGRNITLALPKG